MQTPTYRFSSKISAIRRKPGDTQIYIYFYTFTQYYTKNPNSLSGWAVKLFCLRILLRACPENLQGNLYYVFSCVLRCLLSMFAVMFLKYCDGIILGSGGQYSRW